MDFWQGIALLGIAVAISIGLSEIYQVWMQRKVLTEIRDFMKQIDIPDMSGLADKIGLKVKEGVAEYGETIDLAPIVDAMGASIVANFQAAIPDMVVNGGEAMTEQEMKMIERAQENPIGTVLHMVGKQIAKRPAPTAQAINNTGQIKV